MRIDWRAFIQKYFKIVDKTGQVVPFIFNDVQNEYYNSLIDYYGVELEGVRDNIVKGRQQGFSALIDGLKTAKFIISNQEQAPVFNSQIISHKSEETKPLFKRINLFLDSYLEVKGIDRKNFLKIDNKTSYFETNKGSSMFVGTAGAKTLGRGGTLQSIHWSECAFYPDTPILNASQLITGAEQQVLDSTGMIFRESTGNRVDDLMYTEFFKGLSGKGSYRSIFYEWWKTKEYRKQAPENYDFVNNKALLEVGYTYSMLKDMNLDDQQIYFFITKLEDSETPKMGLREYPITIYDAFLSSGEYFFDSTALKEHQSRVREPIKESLIYL